MTMLISVGIMLSCSTPHSYAGGKALQPPPRQRTTTAPDKNKPDSKINVPDVEVLNQDGKPIKFYTDLVAGKLAFVSFMFATCEESCPMLGENLARLQGLLGDRLGKDVSLISVSLDPENDTPERLKAWGKMFGARSGWTFITGRKNDIDRIIKAFTGGATGKGEHTPIVFIGSAEKGVWIRAFGLTEPSRLVRLIDQAAAAPPNPK
ncbi:MAG TPA: SCO family protein [Pyrinomonadaceae bacterium]|nr:SCO family protein [Pyrinomonadaceae bacterium]